MQTVRYLQLFEPSKTKRLALPRKFSRTQNTRHLPKSTANANKRECLIALLKVSEKTQVHQNVLMFYGRNRYS